MSKKKILIHKIIAVMIFSVGFVKGLEAQKTDMIVLKKNNNRTLKTYFPGSIIMAETYDGFKIYGIIRQIRNDSILLQQRETRLKPTEFGSRLDTLYYSLGINYQYIKKYYYGSGNSFNDVERKDFVKTLFPKIVTRAGIGFFILELVNSIGRKESIQDHNNLTTLGISSVTAAGGYVWTKLHKNRNKVGGKYKALYVKAGTVSLEE